MKKRGTRDCFCALCRLPRKLRYSKHLKKLHYLQIIILTIVVVACTYPWLTWKGIVALPMIWATFESLHQMLYRKDSKCPYCGFDPTWYKKDVKFARQQVEEFLKQNPDSPLLRRTRTVDSTSTDLNKFS